MRSTSGARDRSLPRPSIDAVGMAAREAAAFARDRQPPPPRPSRPTRLRPGPRGTDQAVESDRGRSPKPKLLIFIVAYFAERTIVPVLQRIPSTLLQGYEVEVLVIDDGSNDQTVVRAVEHPAGLPFKLTVLHNPVNQGYGGNQKIGYHYAIQYGFDFVALLHGDGQYAPECLTELAEPLRRGAADAVFGSRMIEPKGALRGRMPYYKFIGNRVLSAIQNRLLDAKLSEFHSGYRLYSTAALQAIPYERNSNDFHFDTEIIIQLLIAKKRIVELPIPTYYGDEICHVNGLAYAKNVIKASLQARLQKANILYDRRFDCAAASEQASYPSKIDFDSTHSRILELIPDGASVLDLGSGSGVVGAELKARKRCWVAGCDLSAGPYTDKLDRFVIADLNEGLPDLGDERLDYILALDVIEHLRSPEDFLDQLRALAARKRARVIISTANIGFVAMRLSLLIGRFEYGKRGILDLTHTRLFTLATLRRALRAAGFEVQRHEGIVVPMPLLLGESRLGSVLTAINRLLVRLWPTLFGFQLLLVAEPRPTLETLLTAARRSAAEILATLHH